MGPPTNPVRFSLTREDGRRTSRLLLVPRDQGRSAAASDRAVHRIGAAEPMRGLFAIVIGHFTIGAWMFA